MKELLSKRDRKKLLVLLILVAILATLLFSSKPKPIAQKELLEKGSNPTEKKEQGGQAQGLPEFPATGGILVLNTDQNALANSLGEVFYTLSNDGKKWVPVINPTLEKELPDGYHLVDDEYGRWAILDTSGQVLFIFNHQNFNWERQDQLNSGDLGPEETAEQVFSCPLANPVRISGPGQTVRVINAVIPLRASPDATSQNFILQLKQGTPLDVMGRPVCTPYLNGANVWWFVRTPDGLEGYVAEGSAANETYYLMPTN